MEVLKQLFEQYFHAPPDTVQPLQGELGGSGRAIIRLSAGAHTAIGILSSVREENVAFLEFSRHFRHHGLPVPAIYAEDLPQGAYLEEDLGDTTLFSSSPPTAAANPSLRRLLKHTAKPSPSFRAFRSRPAAISITRSAIPAPASIGSPSRGISTTSSTTSCVSPASPSTSRPSKTTSAA